MTPAELEFLAREAGKRKRIAEIGSWRGRSTAAIADNTEAVVYAIDTWAGSPETDFDPGFAAGGPEWLWGEFLLHKADNVIPVRMTSVDAAAYFAGRGDTFDMIFIDGAHDTESVKADIAAWRPLLEPGGLLCGHDYFTTVKEAVDASLAAREAPGTTIWVANGGFAHLLPCAILVPSLNRPQNLRRAVANIHENTPEQHFILFMVSDPESMAILDELEEWYIDDSDVEDHRYVTRMNKLISYIDDAKTVFFGSDDVLHRPGWLSQALAVMDGGPSVVVVNDLRNPNGTQAVVRRDYIPTAVFDAPGLAFHPGYLHNFADSEMFLTAQRRGTYARAMNSIVEHLHPVFGSQNADPWDATYTNAQQGWDADLLHFQQRMNLINNHNFRSPE